MVHFSSILTRLGSSQGLLQIAIRLKPAKSADVRANAKCLLFSTKKTTFSRFVSFIKVILW